MTIIIMTLSFAIHYGIVFGFITYTVAMVAKRRSKEIHPAM
jgi:xanthine/uracil/vitamin C permease (AzgA family)